MNVAQNSRTSVGMVVATLKKAIFAGELQPGDQLRESLLTDNLNVSRNSVREALRILSANGLTSHMPNKGVHVRKLNESEVNDIFKTRLILEKQGASNAKASTHAERQRLIEAMDKYAKATEMNDPISIAEVHIQFHEALVGLTGSTRLMELERSLMQELQVVIASVDNDRNDLAKEIDKHQLLTHMVLENQVDEAVKWIESDLSLAKDYVLQQLSIPKRTW